MPYSQALQKRVLARAGLKNTYYGGKINPKNREALSYETGPSGWQLAPETDMSIPGGAGALVSTPADLDRFFEALFGGKLVAASSLATMQTLRDGYGRALFATAVGPQKSYGHNGSIDGFHSAAGYFPDGQLAVAVCSNGTAGSYSADQLMASAARIYFGQPYKIPSFKSFTPAAADLDRYPGTYACPGFPLKITVAKAGAGLTAQATGQGPLPLEATGPGAFTFDPAGIRMEFDAAQPTFTLKQGGATHVFTKE